MDILRNLKPQLPLLLCYFFSKADTHTSNPSQSYVPKPHAYFELVLCFILLYRYTEWQFLVLMPSCLMKFH